MNRRLQFLACVLLAIGARLGATETTARVKEQPVVRPTATPAKMTLTLAQLRAIIKNPGLSGGSAITRSPKGVASVNALRDLVRQEDAAAVATRSLAARIPIQPSRVAGSTSKSGISQSASQFIDGIHTVNGKSMGFLVSPGNNLTIRGRGFGDVEGLAAVALPDGKTAASLKVIRWSDVEIWALLPAGLSGVEDQAAAVRVVTRTGKELGKGNVFLLDHGRFIAERAEVSVVPDGGEFSTSWVVGGSWSKTSYDSHTGLRARFEDGESITCKPAGTDVLTVRQPMRRGFVLVGLTAQWGSTDSGDKDANGNAGSRAFLPGYGFGDWNGDSIPIRWGVWRSHTSPQASLNLPNQYDVNGVVIGVWSAPHWVSAGHSYDVCRSQYAVRVVLSGPRGVPPPILGELGD